MQSDRFYMERALELAKRGGSKVQPNPMVGCVLVKEGRIIGEGYHAYYGGVHAEVAALEDALGRGENAEGATAYVTLEPCAHFGKRPPCASRLVSEKIGRVVAAMGDPNPDVSGKGFDILRKAGISVECGLLCEEATELNRFFLKHIQTAMPYVMLKAGVSLDGKIATASGESQWITSEESREYSHGLRNRVRAVAVGVGTVLADDPLLTARAKNGENVSPIAVVFDSRLRIPEEAKILHRNCEAETVIVTTEAASSEKLRQMKKLPKVKVLTVPMYKGRTDIREALRLLGKEGVASLLVEGGGGLNFSFIEQDLADELLFFVAPKILGGTTAKTAVEGEGFHSLSDSRRFSFQAPKMLGTDVLLTARKSTGKKTTT